MKTRLISLLLLLPLLAFCSTATAKQPSREALNALVQKANLAYRLGRFQEALSTYEKIFQHKQHPVIIFNLGQCHREISGTLVKEPAKRLHHVMKALFFYQLHLSRWDKQNPGKSSPNKQDVGRYVPLLSELKVSLEKKLMVKSEEQPKPIAQSKPTSEPTPAEQVKPAIQPEQVEPSRPPVQPKPLELPSSGKSQIGRSTLWLVSGIATAADLSGQAAGGLDAPEPDGGYLGFQ